MRICILRECAPIVGLLAEAETAAREIVFVAQGILRAVAAAVCREICLLYRNEQL